MAKPLSLVYSATMPSRTADVPPVAKLRRNADQNDVDPSAEIRSAIAAAYDEHHALVYRLALRYGGGRVAWAEDVTQEVFLQLVKHADSLTNLETLGGWLYRTTTRRCLNKLRKDRFLEWVTFDWILGGKEEPAMDGETFADAREELRLVLTALHRLPAKEQVAFSMHYLDGHTLEEIGETLGMSKGYVSKLIKRVMTRLGEEGWEVRNDQ
jgi:RNA polymerase sigma-70 factor (ECF subfamily)